MLRVLRHTTDEKELFLIESLSSEVWKVKLYLPCILISVNKAAYGNDLQCKFVHTEIVSCLAESCGKRMAITQVTIAITFG